MQGGRVLLMAKGGPSGACFAFYGYLEPPF